MPLLCTTTALACFYSATLAWNAIAIDTTILQLQAYSLTIT